MLLAFALLFAIASPGTDPIAAAIQSFDGVTSYRVTLRSEHGKESERIRYCYKKPGFVRMEFITPHNGTVLVYDPGTKQVRVRPFAFLDPLVFTFSPDNSLVKSARGHRVDASDIGAFLMQVHELQNHGRTTVSGAAALSGRSVIDISVEGNGNFSLDGVHRYRLWLDASSMMPLKTAAFDNAGVLIEEVLMDDLELNVALNEELFRL